MSEVPLYCPRPLNTSLALRIHRGVVLAITMMKWIETSRASMKLPLVSTRAAGGQGSGHRGWWLRVFSLCFGTRGREMWVGWGWVVFW